MTNLTKIRNYLLDVGLKVIFRAEYVKLTKGKSVKKFHLYNLVSVNSGALNTFLFEEGDSFLFIHKTIDFETMKLLKKILSFFS